MKSFQSVMILLACSVGIRAQQTGSINIDGRERAYIRYLPADLPADAPLVFVFHGYSGDAESTMNSLSLNEVADANGFAICYPQGVIDQEGNRFWQVGYKMHQPIEVDDVKFICNLAEALQQEHRLSRNNTFITGISNGGDLCNLLLCSTTGIFKAAAPIISCIMKETYDSCMHAEPVPVFMLNGTSDSITYWEGDMEDTQGYGPYLSTPAMLAFRIRQNGSILASADTIYGPDVNDKTSIIVEKYSSPDAGDRVWMYRYINGGHGTPDYLDLAREIWDFFSLHLD
jgi:polyhydroxybutyrate depolymerase